MKISNIRRPMVSKGASSMLAKRMPGARPNRPIASPIARPGMAKPPGGKALPLRPMKKPSTMVSPRMVSGRKPAKKMMVQKMGRKR